MVKKKKDDFLIPGLDDISDFNQIPDDFKSQKPGDYMFVSRAKKEEPLPGESCGYKPSWEVENLDIIKRVGRESWDVVTYSPDQVTNYKSQSMRYDSAIDQIPSYVTPQSNGSIVYGFCSDLAEKGFWEVTIGGEGAATFITLTPPSLTVLCPRPFVLSEFVVVDSDTTTYKWTQISGSRTVFITPDNVKYPTIDIQSSCFTSGCDSMTQSPIRLRVETDKSTIFTDLIIFNRPTDFYYGLGYLGVQDNSVAGKAVTTIYRVPNRFQVASVWVGEDILITWFPPVIDPEFVTRYRIQLLIPPYTDDQIVPVTSTRIAAIQSNRRYRIATDFNTIGALTTSFSDPPISYLFPGINQQTIFADDGDAFLGYTFISNSATTVTFGNQVRDVTDDFFNMLGYAFISNLNITVTFGNQTRDVTDDFFNMLGYAFMLNTYQKIDLGGIVIG